MGKNWTFVRFLCVRICGNVRFIKQISPQKSILGVKVPKKRPGKCRTSLFFFSRFSCNRLI